MVIPVEGLAIESNRPLRRDRGAMLLAVLFMMAIMVITALAVAPAFIQQAKRDREEEMIHRGTEYERAIKKYYKKFGRYPANLEQLENTNQIRFLRKRYKDPLTKDGQWKLLHAGDIQALAGVTGFGAAGLQQGAQGGLQGTNSLNSATAGTGSATGGDLGASTAPDWGAIVTTATERISWRAATKRGAAGRSHIRIGPGRRRSIGVGRCFGWRSRAVRIQPGVGAGIGTDRRRGWITDSNRNGTDRQ